MGTLETFISREYFFVAFIGADYNGCLWIYKIIRFSYCFCKGWVVVVIVVVGNLCKNFERSRDEGTKKEQVWTSPRIRKFSTLEQAKQLANSFLNSQFEYTPLIWMFTSKISMGAIQLLRSHSGGGGGGSSKCEQKRTEGRGGFLPGRTFAKKFFFID